MHKTDVIHFYPAPMSRLQHLPCLATILLMTYLQIRSVGHYEMLIVFTALLWLFLWLFRRFCSRKPYISMSDQGIGFSELFQVFWMRCYAWSDLSGKPKLVRRGLVLTCERAGVRSHAAFIPLAPLSKKDQEKVFELVGKRMDQYGYRPQEKESVRCLQCDNLIGAGKDACPQCGWTWR